MILADTAAWIEYDSGTGSTVDQRMTELIASEGPLAVTEPVVMEVLAGARTNARDSRLHDCRRRVAPRGSPPFLRCRPRSGIAGHRSHTGPGLAVLPEPETSNLSE